jgi:hypothetical protein
VPTSIGGDNYTTILSPLSPLILSPSVIPQTDFSPEGSRPDSGPKLYKSVTINVQGDKFQVPKQKMFKYTDHILPGGHISGKKWITHWLASMLKISQYLANTQDRTQIVHEVVNYIGGTRSDMVAHALRQREDKEGEEGMGGDGSDCDIVDIDDDGMKSFAIDEEKKKKNIFSNDSKKKDETRRKIASINRRIIPPRFAVKPLVIPSTDTYHIIREIPVVFHSQNSFPYRLFHAPVSDILIPFSKSGC